MAKEKKKKRIRSLYVKLEKKHGRKVKHVHRQPFDQLIISILARGDVTKKAKRALKRLQEEFVDWNEVRVSSIWEIDEVLKELNILKSKEKAKRLKRVLESLFFAQNRISLNFLKGLEPSKAKKRLASIPNIDDNTIANILFHSFDHPSYPPNKGVVTFAKRIGIVRHYSSERQVKRVFEQCIPKDIICQYHRLFTEHGEKFCLSQSKTCKRCVLQSDCKWAEKLREKQEKVKKKEEQKKTAKKAKKGKTKKKKKTKKKPAKKKKSKKKPKKKKPSKKIPSKSKKKPDKKRKSKSKKKPAKKKKKKPKKKTNKGK